MPRRVTLKTAATIPTEHDDQIRAFAWLANVAPKLWPDLAIVDAKIIGAPHYDGIYSPKRLPIWAVPNGGHRHKKTAADLKAEGVMSGVLDITVAIPTKVYPALFIEMKRIKGGTTSPQQKHWMIALQQMGYRVRLCKGADAAITAITEYLEGI